VIDDHSSDVKDTEKLRRGIGSLLVRGPLERADLDRAIAEVDCRASTRCAPTRGCPRSPLRSTTSSGPTG